ncbi:MAG: hypothetical protein K0Q55_548 [Verrucomicrobia bacterium]|nr:hypothetical protein [Verrucomicrobiota bacterium]
MLEKVSSDTFRIADVVVMHFGFFSQFLLAEFSLVRKARIVRPKMRRMELKTPVIIQAFNGFLTAVFIL